MSTAARPQVTEWDREYMRRLGRYKAEANAEALRRHLALSGCERLAESERLSRRSRGYAHAKHEVRDPSPLYQIARQLGLYRP